MPTTRSMRSLSSLAGKSGTSPKSPNLQPSSTKRKAQDTDVTELSSQNSKKSKFFVPSTSATRTTPDAGANEILPAVLSFSFETAKQHLINVDPRFEGVFNKLPCRPFEQLERVDPFSTLTTSILGQQISWLAARSIRHRFIRLYDPSLPEKPPTDGSDPSKGAKTSFPTAKQVADTDIATLRSAGLSGRKAEYIKDLASRFADGRLTNKKLIEADDEELANLLIEVRGIGRWTVDMFAMFSLRRPDILPVGDLGVQRGLIRWFLSLHSPSDAVTISPNKLPKPPGAGLESQDATSNDAIPIGQSENLVQEDVLPAPPPSFVSGSTGQNIYSNDPKPFPVTPTKAKGTTTSETPDVVGLASGSVSMLPEPFTPSINKILNPNVGMEVDGTDENTGKGMSPTPLPEGLTVALLKNRLGGKNKIKGAFLTPKEMEELTAPWRPYRSLGVFYMWALAEETTVVKEKKPTKMKKTK